MIELEVLNATDQLEANWQRLLASRQSSILDGRLFVAEKRQFELGLVTSTDVLLAQTDFANSQSAEILALAEYQIALVDLAYATGTLLGADKVRWEPILGRPKISHKRDVGVLQDRPDGMWEQGKQASEFNSHDDPIKTVQAPVQRQVDYRDFLKTERFLDQLGSPLRTGHGLEVRIVGKHGWDQ
jgi:hypothetical protein